ncbi:MAG: hypothetical protein U1E02_07815 [Hydrogenophaga sp.]|nr:hypothetical protein [Hydrogenophaga sp.]
MTLGELAANPQVAANLSGLPGSPLTWLVVRIEELVAFIFGGLAAPGAVEGKARSIARRSRPAWERKARALSGL